MATSLFAAAPLPAHHARSALALRYGWYTWSASFREFIHALQDSRHGLPAPRTIAVRGCAPYAASYDAALGLLDEAARRRLFRFAESLLHEKSIAPLRFFTGMLDDRIDRRTLHRIFALLRSAMARIAANPRSALHSPVMPERRDRGFPLHADLFLTDLLWLVFDDVPDDDSGRSLFLESSRLLRYLQRTDRAAAEQVGTVLQPGLRKDSFNRLFALLHAESNPWHDALQSWLEQAPRQIKLRRGEGYLLDDRKWLHGRTAASGPVRRFRFHRLVYGPLA